MEKHPLVVLRFAFLTHCPVPIFQGLKPQIALKKKKKKKGTARERGKSGGKMWLRRSRSTGLAREKVEFVTKQRKGWCFLSLFCFSFFWCFILPLLFWIPAGSLAAALPPLSVAKIFGHIPLSYTMLHKIKLRDEKRHNLKRLGEGEKGAVKQPAARVSKEKGLSVSQSAKKKEKKKKGLASGIKKKNAKKSPKKVSTEEARFRVRIFLSLSLSLQTCYLPNASLQNDSPLPPQTRQPKPSQSFAT